ncbi:sulfite exporter TauE/SafE family protein [Pseudomonas fulva]|uniref:sulfite exporter TauE/SafE family protein n=1 Tax=Pseudomonas fulva TaxID=47880 RepID=UPI00201E213E|nr:sulfite exporter TauE/SafE family protein [Pseudomonas fulva]UQY33463.1 sulfite exporter TauE/SafE family protein [Pseudomonas fulva]
MHDATFYLLFLFATFLAAGLVKGVTGMGLPTVAMGLLGTLMAPAAAAAILIVPSLVTNLWQLFSGPALAPLLRRLWPMMLCIVLGTLAASALLVVADPLWSGFWLGIALVVYALYALLAPTLRVAARLERWLSPVVGLATGAVTGATGVFVMPAVPYLGSLNLSRDELVQALGLSFSVSTLALAIGLYWHGAFQVSQLGTSTAAIVPALLGMWLGQRLRARISPVRFRQCFMAFLILLGVELASRPLF